MAAIAKNFASGGSGLVPGYSGGVPTLADILRDIAADLADLKGAAPAAAISAGALPAFTDPPSAAEMSNLRTLVNQMRAAMVEAAAGQTTRSGVTLRTTAP